jgi:hypothetical protein
LAVFADALDTNRAVIAGIGAVGHTIAIIVLAIAGVMDWRDFAITRSPAAIIATGAGAALADTHSLGAIRSGVAGFRVTRLARLAGALDTDLAFGAGVGPINFSVTIVVLAVTDIVGGRDLASASS